MKDLLGVYPYFKNGRSYSVSVFVLADCSLAESWPEASLRERILVAPEQAAQMVAEPELKSILLGLE
jgi:hypothetical protein